MATLAQLREIVGGQFRDRVEGLVSAVEEDSSDFMDVAGLADEVAELADTIAQIYSDLEERLSRGLNGGAGADGETEQPTAQVEETAAQAAQAEEPTKAELLEQARELDVEGRSSMSKEELAEAVEAEEHVTKEELLERAREAGIEGRSSMTKEELRKALSG